MFSCIHPVGADSTIAYLQLRLLTMTAMPAQALDLSKKEMHFVTTEMPELKQGLLLLGVLQGEFENSGGKDYLQVFVGRFGVLL